MAGQSTNPDQIHVIETRMRGGVECCYCYIVMRLSVFNHEQCQVEVV